MKENRTIFDYLAQVLIIFGFSMLCLNIFCLVFGEAAREYSSMFRLGRQGIPAEIAFQYLGVSALITGARYLFFTDRMIRKMAVWLRTVCMLGTVILIISASIVLFGWFPTDMWQPWVLFFVCFGVSFLGSLLLMSLKEKIENRKLNEALDRLKEKERAED